MINNSISGLIFEIRSINYSVIHVHDAKAMSQILNESRLTADRKQTADLPKIMNFHAKQVRIVSYRLYLKE